MQMAHCLVVLFRLSIFESPDVPWDRQRVRQELDFGELVRLWALRWENVPAAAGLDTDIMGEKGEGPWSFTRKRFLILANYWDAKVAAMAAADAEKKGGQAMEDDGTLNGFGAPGQQPMDALDFGAVSMDSLDDVWMRDMFGGYEFPGEPYF